ncbi:MAG TPA: arginine--tRNA ligase, partial [Candidatus Paceibacterota bacterium]|nr:arginine--tRNA ligase [Candidatus Paceibacterota bacterium]
MESKIRSIVSENLARLGAADISFAVEWPADLAHGDFAVNAALAASKQLGKAPREIAEELVAALREGMGADAEKVEAAGPGFVNVTLSKDAITRELRPAQATPDEWGGNADQNGKRVMIEYTDPNPFKEMHIG